MPATLRRPVRRPAILPHPPRPAPLPAAVVDAVLRHHDVAQDLGGGRTLLRISPARLADAEVAGALGALASRALGVCVLWNEREDEIVRVWEDTLQAALAA